MNGAIMKKLWVTAKEVGVDSETLHDRVKQEFNKDSVRKMTDGEAAYIIDILIGKPEPLKPVARGMMTLSQQYLIKQLADELGWGDNPARLQGFVKKYTGIDAVNWLTVWQASNVIEGLKKLKERLEDSG